MLRLTRSPLRGPSKRCMSALPAYAFNPVAKFPGKRHPLQAQPKALSVSQLDNGMQVVSSDDKQSPISSLALVVNAGTRFQEGQAQQGIAQWLKAYGFKTTNHRSTIRITREAEIMGHCLSTGLTRENIFYQVEFRRDDLPDVVDLLADTLDGLLTRDAAPWGMYTREFVRKTKDWQDAALQADAETALAHEKDPATLMFDSLFRVAFRQGLGNPLYPTGGSVDVKDVLTYVQKHVTPGKVTLVGSNVDAKDVSSSAKYYFGGLKAGAAGSAAPASRYFGGEHFEEVQASDDIVYGIAFQGAPISQNDYFTAQVLQHLLGGNQDGAVKNGTSHGLLGDVGASAQAQAFSSSFSDAGLFGVMVRGTDAAAVSEAAHKSVAALKEVAAGRASAEAVKRAVEATSMAFADDMENAPRFTKIQTLLTQAKTSKKLHTAKEMTAQLNQVTAEKITSLAGKMLKSKPSIAAVGDAFSLPHADDFKL